MTRTLLLLLCFVLAACEDDWLHGGSPSVQGRLLDDALFSAAFFPAGLVALLPWVAGAVVVLGILVLVARSL
jgi:hypothetical protein